MARVRQEVERFRDEKIDALVLGCTHFLHLEDEFRALLGREGITLVDSRDGVTRQVKRLIAEDPRAVTARGRGSLYVTGPVPLEERYSWFAGGSTSAWKRPFDRHGGRPDGGSASSASTRSTR